jgi:hypothetical protein
VAERRGPAGDAARPAGRHWRQVAPAVVAGCSMGVPLRQKTCRSCSQLFAICAVCDRGLARTPVGTRGVAAAWRRRRCVTRQVRKAGSIIGTTNASISPAAG